MYHPYGPRLLCVSTALLVHVKDAASRQNRRDKKGSRAPRYKGTVEVNSPADHWQWLCFLAFTIALAWWLATEEGW